MTMILRSSPASPFGRKVKIAAAILDLSDRITVEFADPNDAGDTLRGQNPLGKIPVLITEDGMSVYDSRVIAEYLDGLAGGGKIIPASGAERLQAMILQALADGIMDAGILQVYEQRMRPEDKRHEPWLEYQSGKIGRALDSLESGKMVLHHTPTIGEIAIACALGYLDLRFEGAWRTTRPQLVDWLNAFASAVPAFEKTKAAT